MACRVRPTGVDGPLDRPRDRRTLGAGGAVGHPALRRFKFSKSLCFPLDRETSSPNGSGIIHQSQQKKVIPSEQIARKFWQAVSASGSRTRSAGSGRGRPGRREDRRGSAEDLPRQREVLPQGRTDFPRGRMDSPQGKLSSPQGKLDFPQGQMDSPQG